MRGTRWLLLAAILAILGGTGFIYFAQKRVRARNPTPKPPEIANGLSATAEDWEWSRTDAGKAVVKIRAHQLRQMEDANSIELEGVTLNLFQKDGQHADLVKSAKAMFDKAKGTLTSEGDVEIYLSVPTGAEPTDNLTRIRSAGISFDSKTGKATTDHATSFRFEGGEGTCVGAAYDPTTRELHLTKQVVMNLRGKAPGAKTMKIETDELTYKEAESVIWLTPKARLTREHSILDAGPSVVNLKEGKIQTIAAHDGHGVDTYPKRKLDYSAGMMVVNYNAEGQIEKVLGMDKPRLVSEAEGSSTSMNATQVDLDFVEKDGESVLTHALGNGNAVVENRQLPDPAKRQKTPETRILRSALLDLYMRPEGKELDKVVTRTPGTLEFLPNEPEQHRRLLNGDKMTIVYGPKNSVQSFATTQAATQTFPNQLEIARAQKAKAPPPAVSKTSSVNMTAEFDAKSQMTHMKQWDNFIYEEGDRHARAATATLDNDKNLMDLDAKARVWDASGSTDADRIQIDQKTGNYNANGHVNTSRLPDKDKDASSSDLLDGDQPIQGRADHMTSANRNKLIHYDGNSVLWQGSDRVQADRIDIDREKQTLIAEGKVVTQLIDRPKDDEPKPATAAFTVVKAARLVYKDDDRLAHYTGGAVMTRPGLFVKGQEIRAFLSEKEDEDAKPPAGTDKGDSKSSGSRLDKAFSDGEVTIVDSSPIRKRTGTGVHAEYYTDNERVILRGNEAVLVDSLKGTSQGGELVYFVDDDKVVVKASAPAKQVKTHMKKK
jgi:lipopolysaccharide export system protein LptA